MLRRFSGGGAVVLGPGCLNYALGVSLVSYPELEDVAVSFRTILGRIAAALSVTSSRSLDTDLALNGRKVSGNAQRRGRRAHPSRHASLRLRARFAARYLKDPPASLPTARLGRTRISSGTFRSRFS